MNHTQLATELLSHGFVAPICLQNPKYPDDAEAIACYSIWQKNGVIVQNEPIYRMILRAYVLDMRASEDEKHRVLDCLINRPTRIGADSLSSAICALNESKEFGKDSCIVNEFERVGEMYLDRAADYIYQEINSNVKYLPIPDWLTECWNSNEIIAPQSMIREVAFGIDFTLCAEYLKAHGLIPVCDGSVRSLFLKGAVTNEDRKYLEIFDSVTFTGPHVLRRLVKEREDVVWISSGSSFGCPLRSQAEKLREIYTEGRLLGVGSGSMLNGGYGGISLYKFTHENTDIGLGERVINFHCGRSTIVDSDNK